MIPGNLSVWEESPPASYALRRRRGKRLEFSARATLPYVVAALLVAAAALLTVALKPLAEKTSTILFFAAVVISSYTGGLRPALFAVLVSCLAWAMFVVPPEYSFAIESTADAMRLALFVTVAVLTSSLYEQLARARRELVRQRARLDLALESAHMGVWDYDLDRDQFWISPELREILGAGEEEFSPTYGGFLAFVHPDDRALVVRTMTTAAAGASGDGVDDYQIEYRIVRRCDNAIRWIATRGRTVVGPDGRAERMIGVVVNVAQRQGGRGDAMSGVSRTGGPVVMVN